MKKYNVHTTLSSKHWEILKKYREKYGIQQKVIELALESLDSPKQSQSMSPEDEVWIRTGKDGARGLLLIFNKNGARVLFETADLGRIQEYIDSYKPVEFAIEYFYRKPLKKCTLQEIIDGMLLNIKIQGSADTLNYTEDSDYYMINLTHSMGLNFAKMIVWEQESLLKSYGVEFESHFSERSMFFKICKNS